MYAPVVSPGSLYRRVTIATIVLAVVALAGACAERDSPTTPNAYHSLSGRVQLVGHLVTAAGTHVGTRVADDADGVPVELLFGPNVLATTTTVDGIYRFSGLTSGAYRTRSTVIGNIGDETMNITIANTDVFSADVLVIESQGDIDPMPNPSSGEVVALFGVAGTQFVDLQIRDLAGGLTRTLYKKTVDPGLQQALWTGHDESNNPVTAPYYWITFESGADKRAQLLFR